MELSNEKRIKTLKIVGIAAIVVNVVLAIGKVISGIVFNSVSVLGDGIHSSIDVIAAVITWLSMFTYLNNNWRMLEKSWGLPVKKKK